jgi:hypothetical protein
MSDTRNGTIDDTRSLVAPGPITAQGLEQVLIGGDLANLSPADRVSYYDSVCKSLGLNPLTKPFEYIVLNDKLTLYARRDATDQLRKLHGISLKIVGREKLDSVYIVTASATTTDGRQDESTGAVALAKEDGTWETAATGKRYFKKNGQMIPLRGEDLANAMMKAETKAKRRVTLSIVGLGWLDETEIETIPNAAPEAVNTETGEILPQPQLTQPRAPTTPAKRPPTDDELNERYDKLQEKAIILGVSYKARLDTWSRSQTVDEGMALNNRIRAAEEAGSAKA